MKPKKIKLFWTVGLIITLLASATVALSVLWPRLFPSFYVSDLYRRYENNENIRATELHNFPVNDTLAVDVLLLEAATDSAWCELLAEFGMPEEFLAIYNADRSRFVSEDRNSISLFFIDKNDPTKRLRDDNPDSRLVILSHTKKTLCVFITEDVQKKINIEKTELKKLKE